MPSMGMKQDRNYSFSKRHNHRFSHARRFRPGAEDGPRPVCLAMSLGQMLDDFWLINFSAEYRLSASVSLTGRVENLLDEKYEEVFSFVAPGLSAFGGITARF